MDVDAMYRDKTGVCCPACRGDQALTYREIPQCRVVYENDGTNHTEFLPAQRIYVCGDCDHDWMMSEATHD